MALSVLASYHSNWIKRTFRYSFLGWATSPFRVPPIFGTISRQKCLVEGPQNCSSGTFCPNVEYFGEEKREKRIFWSKL